jgi:predicted dehydrogenase
LSEALKLAVVGVGRMGVLHALHAAELERETGACRVAAICDTDTGRARAVAAGLGLDVPVFGSVAELAASGVAQASFIVSPTDRHREHASALIEAGQRVLLEKPLTGSLEDDRTFAAHLDAHHPDALMLAFQRRFDGALAHARDLAASGLIGRVFKIVSALEDSNPAPDGYQSGGILPDMSVHNVDEILWLTGALPERALSIGTRIYSHKLTTCQEDFDDAFLYMWFAGELTAQVQVSRNHVSGYRVETWLFGEEGQIHVGRFEQSPFDVVVEAYGRRGRSESLARRVFRQRDYGKPLPEFADRFGEAYKSELAVFIDCCNEKKKFPTTHRDGVRAMEVIAAGMRAIVGREQAAAVGQ